jgi:ribonuclease Y
MIVNVLIGLIALILGSGIGYWVRYRIGKKNAYSLENLANRKLDEASQEANSKKKEGEIQVKAEVLKAKETFEKTTKTRRKELEHIETRISQRETNLDRKVTMLDKKSDVLDAKQEVLKTKEESLKRDRVVLAEKLQEEAKVLERLSGMTQDEARDLLLDRVEKDIQNDIAGITRRLQEDAKANAEREARKIIASLKDKDFNGIIALVGGDDAFNRRVIETLKINQ